MSHASQPAGMFAQLLGASAARRRGGPPADDGPGGGPAPGEFDVEQLLSLFVERAIQAQGLGGGGGGKHFSLRLPSDEQLATAQDLLTEDVSMGVGSGAPAGGPQPASRAAVEALPTVEIGAAHAEKSCAICCEPFVPEKKGLPPFSARFLCPLPFPACLCRPRAWFLSSHGCRVRVFAVLELPCTHIYCETCILPWLRKSNSCPVCRHELETETGPTPKPTQLWKVKTPPAGTLWLSRSCG